MQAACEQQAASSKWPVRKVNTHKKTLESVSLSSDTFPARKYFSLKKWKKKIFFILDFHILFPNDAIKSNLTRLCGALSAPSFQNLAHRQPLPSGPLGAAPELLFGARFALWSQVCVQLSPITVCVSLASSSRVARLEGAGKSGLQVAANSISISEPLSGA